MSRSINQFVENWHVWWVDGESPVLKQAYKLAIGTEQGTEPFLNENGEPSVGFVLSQPDGLLVLSSFEHGPLVLQDGSLRWNGAASDGAPLRIYISLAESLSKDDKVSFSMYGTTLYGDPEQVAVWGANDTPP